MALRGSLFALMPLVVLQAGLVQASPVAPPPVVRVQSVQLPTVKGGFDLMAIDLQRGRLMVDAEDNDTTEVVEVEGRGRHLTTIRGMHAPKWVVYRPELHKIYVANGNGTVRVLTTDYKYIRTINLGLLANNLRYDDRSKRLIVGLGDKSGQIAVIDALSDRILYRIPLPSYPKQMEIDGDRLLVNLPAKNAVQVIDWTTRHPIATWPACAHGNVPMALDRTTHRLFVGCDEGRLLTLDSRSGKQLASVKIDQNPDGLGIDAANHLVYASTNAGFVDVIGNIESDAPKLVQRIATRKGAGTSLFVASLHRLFVPFPQEGRLPAEIVTFKTR